LLARSLAAKTTQTLGLVVTNTLYHGVYFSELLFHTARMTEDKGRQLFLADGKHSAEEERRRSSTCSTCAATRLSSIRVFSAWMRWTISSMPTPADYGA
jgi:DNA-binding LacI/PurR family transcriptional regulator